MQRFLKLRNTLFHIEFVIVGGLPGAIRAAFFHAAASQARRRMVAFPLCRKCRNITSAAGAVLATATLDISNDLKQLNLIDIKAVPEPTTGTLSLLALAALAHVAASNLQSTIYNLEI